MKRNNKGFTLAELLIVVAIIAVLVAISIPIFTTQLEKSREATDMANIRGAYAEVAASALTAPKKTASKEVELTQTQDDWQSAADDATLNIAGLKLSSIPVTAGGKVVVKYKADGKDAGTITIGGVEVPKSNLTTEAAASGSGE